MKKFVDLEALNLRSAPEMSPETRIAILHLGQPVEVLSPAPEPGWIKVKATVGGVAKTGVVKAEINGQPSLRSPVSPQREALVAQAIAEWLRFEKGQGQEHHAPYFSYIGEMWQAIGLNLDGRDRDQFWSAAAISFMVRNAGNTVPKYKKFKFAAAHARYMHDAIIRREKNDTKAPFWGFRLHEVKPEIGDIACKWRESPRDFDDAANSDAFKSHTDIIVSVQPDFVLAIGGNVGQSVNITRYAKTGAGFLAPQDQVFMHMVNRT
jgi:hypothetical protein